MRMQRLPDDRGITKVDERITTITAEIIIRGTTMVDKIIHGVVAAVAVQEDE